MAVVKHIHKTASTAQAALPSPPSRVLLAGPSAESLAAAVRRVRPTAEVEVVETALDALAEVALAAEAHPFEAVVADVREAAEVQALRDRLDVGGLPAGRLVVTSDVPDDWTGHGADDTLALPAADETLRQTLFPTSVDSPTPAKRSTSSGVPELDAHTLLDAMTTSLGHGVEATVAKLNRRLDAHRLALVHGERPSEPFQAPITNELHLVWHGDAEDEAEADVLRHDLMTLAELLSRLAAIDRKHCKLKRLALFDDLTGCANKKYFHHFLGGIIERAKRDRFPVTLLVFDIDNFKLYNDRHGHATGDRILKETGELIRRCVRDHDFVGRIGGDEFAVIFCETHDGDTPEGIEDHRRTGRVPKGPLQIAARFRRLISSPEFAALGSSGVGRLTISGGMAVYPYDASDAEGLLAKADHALLFGAKRGGKDGISLVGEGAEDVDQPLP
ncbi:MAG: GGDEF domain-containing protein [Planctomycetota bacterium]